MLILKESKPWIGSLLLFLVHLRLVNSYGIEDVTYVGCFHDISFLELPEYVKPVTWEICIHLCLNKLMMYAGVQSRKNSCYCASEMYQQPKKGDEWYCQHCYEDTDKWCGGYNWISLYQLKPRGSSQLAILLATDGGIQKVITENNSNSSEILQLAETSATSIAYHYINQDIYFISKNKIFKLSYKPLLMEYIHPLLIIDGDCNDRSDLDLDWERDIIYWACASTSKVKQADLEGAGEKQSFHNAVGLKYVAVEPYTRLIYFTRKMTLSKYDFSTFKENILDGEYSFKKVFQLAIDIQQEVVYVIGSYDGNKKTCLVSLNYSCTVFKVLYQGEELSNPVGLDAFNGTIIWGRVENSNYVIYRGKIASKGHLEKVTVIHTGTQKVNDLKIYHPNAQRPSTDYLCRKKECSHSCTVISSVHVQCSCPTSSRENFTNVLANDSKTCIDIPNNESNSQTTTTEWITSTYELLSSESPLTEDLGSSMEYSSTDYTVWSEKSEARSETEEITVVSTTNTPLISEHYTLKSSQLSRVTPNHESVSHLLFSCGLILILVFVIPFQVYIVIWLRRTNRTFRPLVLYHRSSELVELT